MSVLILSVSTEQPATIHKEVTIAYARRVLQEETVKQVSCKIYE